ncbi:MAG: LysR family transcriptional regulator [Lachnospiraceae bacterium]|nr:LysR family transcriptional regulator [Lachnospiraceae bacterium]
MDVKYLKYILAIAERRNMTKAAEELYVSQSSLSQYLSRLEQELNTPLFYRAKGELTLTPAGELYVKAARQVVEIQKNLYKDIASLDKRGHISVGVTSNFALRMLSEIIPEFKQTYPEVTVEISEVGLPAIKKMLAEELLDLGIAAAPDTASFDGNTYVLRKEEVLFAVPKLHPYVFKNTGTTLTTDELLANFSGDNFLLSKRGSSLRALSDQLFESCHFTPCTVCETNNITATRNMVANHTGVAFVAESCAVDRNYIKYYSLEPALYRLNLIVTRKNWKRNEPENVFYSYLTNYFNEHTERPYMAENYVGTFH